MNNITTLPTSNAKPNKPTDQTKPRSSLESFKTSAAHTGWKALPKGDEEPGIFSLRKFKCATHLSAGLSSLLPVEPFQPVWIGKSTVKNKGIFSPSIKKKTLKFKRLASLNSCAVCHPLLSASLLVLLDLILAAYAEYQKTRQPRVHYRGPFQSLPFCMKTTENFSRVQQAEAGLSVAANPDCFVQPHTCVSTSSPSQAWHSG